MRLVDVEIEGVDARRELFLERRHARVLIEKNRTKPTGIRLFFGGKNVLKKFRKTGLKQGSVAEDSVGPHSGRPVLLWPTMKIWIVCFHF